MTPREILIAARALIADPEHWCQGKYEQSLKNGVRQRCALGAINTVGEVRKEGCRAWARALATLAQACPIIGIARYNDTHTHAEVLALFDHAIAACGEEES